MTVDTKKSIGSWDEQFDRLLHQKIMHKKGANKRQMKKYYSDQYQKTGRIPQALKLVEKGIFDGRQCSGRKPVISPSVVKRLVQMIKASADQKDDRFIFITQKARKIKTYQHCLEEEFNCTLSFHALNRCVQRENLSYFLKKPDDEANLAVATYFNPVKIFELIQVDGCTFQFIKIKTLQGIWKKPKVIEFFDTESRYLFCLGAYFAENNENSVHQFTQFLLSTPFPDQKIRFRPDNAKAFINLKRPIRELNQKYSLTPDGFYLDPDFAGNRSPKHKVHLETSHRALHNDEILLIKEFEDRIVKTEQACQFSQNKKRVITITYLDITLKEINESVFLKKYRQGHNEKSHQFSREGITQIWIPVKKFNTAMQSLKTIEFNPLDIQYLMRYGFEKNKATVSKSGTITYAKCTYTVVQGREQFSTHSSTPVKVSLYEKKLQIFEPKVDGVWLGDALPQVASIQPTQVQEKETARLQGNEVEQIACFLKQKGAHVDITRLINFYHQGLTLAKVKTLFVQHQQRYKRYTSLVTFDKDKQTAGIALFNAFLMDCERIQAPNEPAPYARYKGDDQ